MVNAAEEQMLRDELDAALEDDGGRIPQELADEVATDLARARALLGRAETAMRQAPQLDPQDQRVQEAFKRMTIAKAMVMENLRRLDEAGF